MQTQTSPRTQEPSRALIETLVPDPKGQETPKSIDPEPHWEIVIDAATD